MSLYKRFAFRGALVGVLTAASVITGSILLGSKPVIATDAGDCGKSSIITCGVKSVSQAIEKYNSSATVKGTFNAFGISTEDLNKLNSKAVLGTVYEDFFDGHDVIVVNNKIVAINAMTAGRVNVSGSSLLGNLGGVNIYKRPYHLSNHRAKQAFVYMENGQFQFGIIAECGNPITGDTPKIDIDKEISKDGVNFKENASFKDGETATFRITVRETNGGFASNVIVKDKIPTGYEYVKGSTRLDGKKVADITDGPVQLGGLNPNQTKVVTFKATVKLIGKECGTNKIPNTAVVNSDQTNPQEDGADGTVTKDCKVVTKCESLAGPAKLEEGDKATYIAKASAEYTTIKKYVFKVDGKVEQEGNKKEFEYTATAGTHMIAVYVHFANGDIKGGKKDDCAKEVKVTKQPVASVECDSLTASIKDTEILSGKKVTYTAKATAKNTKLSGFIFKVNGDVVKETNSADDNTYVFTAGKVGEYVISVVAKAGNLRDTDKDCVKKITVKVPVSSLVCDELKISKNEIKVNESVVLTATGTAKNTKITGYAFYSNGIKIAEGPKDSIVFKAFEAKEYTLKVVILGEKNMTATNDTTCVKKLKVVEEVKPVLVCDSLDASATELELGKTVVYTGKGSATNTSITGYIFRVNGVKAKETNSANDNKFNFTPTKVGTYTVKLLVKGEDGKTTTNNTTCVKTVKVVKIVKPSLVCDSLSISKDTIKLGESVTLTVNATATNTKIVGYDYYENGVKSFESVSNTVVFVPEEAKVYTLKVVVKGENGLTATNNTTCVKTVNVTEVVTPVYACNLLTVTPTSIKPNEKVSAVITFTARNGAEFVDAVLDFGDGSSTIVTKTNGNKTVAVDHVYATKGAFTIVAKVNFMVNGNPETVVGTIANGCAKEVKVSETPVCETNPNLPADSPECFEHCPYPGLENYPEDSDKCVEPELPNTGAGSTIGIFSVTSFIGALIYRTRLARRGF